jgi:natural product biosynthesis luciferase-like monooxygenase protein/amino acid adenylation domain-containing protein
VNSSKQSSAFSFADFDILSEVEKAQLLYGFNSTAADYPVKETIVSLFEKQVERTPEHIAFIFEQEQVTYRELNEQAGQIAAYLRKVEHIKAGDLVGLMLTRERLLIPAIFGILKAGAAYLPIDPAYPAERINAIAEDAKLNVILSRGKQLDALLKTNPGIVNLDELLMQLKAYPAAASVKIDSSSLAYVIYTSGSTGRPKGVMIAHSALVNYTWWANRFYVKNEQATFPLYSSISFDLTITSIFTPLIAGNTIVIYGEDNNSSLIEKVIAENESDIVKLTPSHLKIIRDSETLQLLTKSKVKKFIVGGEELDRKLAKAIHDKFNGAIELYNEYGPTETTVGCMIHQYDPESDSISVPIGQPISNTQIYVLDKFLKPVPKNVMGELYIAGDGLAQGYLFKEALTAERFVANPFIKGKRMYRSGDYAKRLSDGTLIFLGRIDEQVKISGYRIELGEIENLLSTHPFIKESAVVSKEYNGEKQLVTYYTSEKELEPGQLRSYLSVQLPEYMLPVHYIQLQQLPLTSNAKLDRRALSELEVKPEIDFIAPATVTENTLVEIWSNVLKLEREQISVTANFLELGGHSIKVILMLNKVQKQLNVKVAINDAFKYPTVKSLAAFIQELTRTDLVTIPKAAHKTSYALSSSQKRLYFLYQFNPLSLAYNMPKMLELKGKLDKVKLTETVNKLVKRQQGLRTFFEVIDEAPVQKIAPGVDFEIMEVSLNGISVTESIRSFIRPFDLSKAPLLRVGLIELSAEHAILMIDMHHIITDGVSENVLIADFMAFYNSEELPALHLQYTDYAEWEQSETQQKLLLQQKAFWIKQFSQKTTPLNLPTDFVRPAVQRYEGDFLSFELNIAETTGLKLLASKTGTTIFMVLLGIYHTLLSKLSGQTDFVIGTPIAGRKHPDLERIIGVFINMLPLRIRVEEEMIFSSFLSEIKKQLLTSFDNQDYAYETLIDELKLTRDTSHNPLFDVMFAFQNFEETKFALNGLIITPYEREHTVSKLDLSLEAVEAGDKILFNVEYATALFKKETINGFITFFKQIVATVSQQPHTRISEIELLPEKERKQLLIDFNDTDLVFQRDETIVSLFEKQVLQSPDRTAVVYEGKKLSYEKLNAQANKLAHFLRENHAIQPNDVIAIIAERSERMLIGLLGILKSGAAYLPIDPAYPKERIAYILKNSKAQIVLLCDELKQTIDFNGEIVRLNDIKEKKIKNPVTTLASTDLSYLIYTSGSTGKPKGVMIMHRNVVNFMSAMSAQLPITEDDCMLAVTSTSFDISVLELFWTLCNGLQVVIHPSDISLNGLDRYIAGEDQSMDFSLFFFSSYNNSEKNKYNLLLESVKYADEAGFNATWIPERHFHEFGGLYPNPSVISSALAMITKKIELRSGSIVSPLHDPLRIAEEWSVVDNLSGGRVGLSFASGWNPDDFALSKDAYKDRQTIMYEQINTIRSLWKGETIQRENGVGQEVALRIFPVPVQKELPVWITSSGNEETFKSAGAIGANLLTHLLGQEIQDLARKIKLYKESRAKHGFDADGGKVAVMLHTFVGEDINEVERLVEQPFTDYLKSSLGLNKLLMEEVGLGAEDMLEDKMKGILKNAFLRYYKTSSLIGTKSKCSEMILKLKEIGVNEIACLIDFGIEERYVMQGLQQLKELKALFEIKNDKVHKPITMMQSTPSFIKLAQEGDGSKKFLKSLQTLLLGGEAVPLSLVNKLQNQISASVFNMYGPTETTVWSCMHKFEKNADKVYVGKPIANTQVYVLDKNLKLVPAGVSGDLYIGGEGLSPGYWERTALTSEKFINNPFDPTAKIYSTGDKARWSADGNLELTGREDAQVKIRGYRIELGEIESLLGLHEQIQQAAVVCNKKDGDNYLAGYYVSGQQMDPGAVRNYLSLHLPLYMLPSYLIQLETMPLTPNGKIDRKNLPDPERMIAADYLAPSNKTEETLLDIWSDVLKMDKARIGVTHNFFEIGGHSLSASVMINKINKNYQVEVPLNEIFNKLTIESLADYLITIKQVEYETENVNIIELAI